MQKSITRLVVMFILLTLMVSGCAKKPVETEPMEVVEETTMVVEEEQPMAVVEEPIDEVALAREAAEAAARRAMSGLERVYFEFDQYVLTDAARQSLAHNADLLKAAANVKVQVEGHCDERGSDEYNLALGEKRALATKNYLVSLGVAADRMSTISYGEELPLDFAQTEAAWAKNRRAEFKTRR